MHKQISFYSERFGKRIFGAYSLSGRMITVATSDGRQKSVPLGGTTAEVLARLTLTELEAGKSDTPHQDRAMQGKNPGHVCGDRGSDGKPR
jgi:hypothetical protein